ncbi:MAG TPA: hypothetical protein VF952_03665 [Chloroflexia bacterium]
MLILMTTSALDKPRSVPGTTGAENGTDSGRAGVPGEVRGGARVSLLERVGSLATFRRWYWALVPLLAIAAYVTVVRIGFLSEDMGLNRIVQGETGWQAILPNDGLRFYRPLGFLLTWRINWPLFGLNPFPYHLEGLLVHAAAAMLFGLWLADITRKRWLGWLAGVLFGVFPLNMEAVGWLATQWDLWAAVFGTLAVWLFSKWWRGDGKGKWGLYAGSVLFYFLGIFTKESLFAFIPIIALSAWYVLPPKSGRGWARMGLALVPHAAVLGLNLLVRQLAWGEQRNYAGVDINYLNFLYDWPADRLRFLLAPIESVIFGEPVVQVVATLSAIGLLVGLVLYGREVSRLLLVAAAWMVLTLAPVLNIGIFRHDFQNSRLLYLVSAGYCLVVAALLWSAIRHAKRARWPLISGTGILVIACVAVTWIQLHPWHTASVQAAEVESELERLIPMQARPQEMVWYINNVPDRYKGAWVLNSAMSRTRYMPGGEADIPHVVRTDNIELAPLGADARDSFALRWEYNPEELRWHVHYGLGITSDSGPPTAEGNTGSNVQVWDFRGCDPAAIEQWEVINASAKCEPGKGLVLSPTNVDPQVANQGLNIAPSASGDRYVRVRASFHVHAGAGATAPGSQLFWSTPVEYFNGFKQRRAPVPPDGSPHVLWAFLAPHEIGPTLAGLRFDPVDAVVPVELRWIAVDTVR